MNSFLASRFAGGISMKTVRVVSSIVVLLLALLTLMPQEVRAQGSFYAEETKDGRIYVFNLMKVYRDWKESGEMGVSITRPGAGPNGETMVFDSNEAIHLYNFKHDLPPEVMIQPEEKKPLQKFGWKDGKTTFESDNASLIISNRIQFRYTLEDPATSGVPASEVGDTKGSFRIRRARTKFEGWFFDPNLTYELQVDWAATTNLLQDAQLTYDVTRGKKMLFVKIGQYKVPFGRQQLTSSGNQEFVDRSIVSDNYARGRDLGVQLSGLPANGKIDWRVGVFNGNGRTVTANDNTDYQVNARLSVQPWGDPKYSESDFESTDKPLIAFAGQFENNRSFDSVTLAESERRIFGGDVVLKYKGLFVFAEGFAANVENPITGANFDSPGWAVQAGYFIVKQKFEVAGRYATFDPTDAATGNDRNEWGVALGYFWSKHNLKLQSDYRKLEDGAKGVTNDEFRTQLQFIF